MIYKRNLRGCFDRSIWRCCVDPCIILVRICWVQSRHVVGGKRSVPCRRAPFSCEGQGLPGPSGWQDLSSKTQGNAAQYTSDIGYVNVLQTGSFIILIITIINTEREMSSFWWNYHHWQHWKLSFWQLSVQPVMIISPGSFPQNDNIFARHFCFSE